jgi:uncharacterized protein YndB with AHSA1/START domain
MTSLRRDAFYPHPIEAVWLALTDPRALAEWLMPNNFEPKVGKRFRFHVDPSWWFSGVTECEVLEVNPPTKLVYTWEILPRKAGAPRHVPMRLTWTLAPEAGGTRLTLVQEGIEHIGWWYRKAMGMGWGRMLHTLLPKVVANVRDGRFVAGAITRRDYGVKTVPEGYAR